MNMQMSELMMSIASQVSIHLYTDMTEISYFRYVYVRLALSTSLNRLHINVNTNDILIWGTFYQKLGQK